MCGKLPDQSMTEKTRYTNWDHGISGGTLVVNANGKRYRIERRVTPAAKAVGKEKVKIIDLESGAEVLKGVVPGEYFFGVTEDVFSQSAFSAQGSGSLVDSEKMNNAIDNILFSGNESVSVKNALKKLDDARVFLMHKNKKGGKLYNMDCEINELKERLRLAEDNEALLAVRNRTLQDNRKQLEECKKEIIKAEDSLTQIEANAVLLRYADLDRKKEAVHSALKAQKDCQDQYTQNGFLPSSPYRDSLRTLHANIDIAEKEIASLVKQKEAFSPATLSQDDSAILEKTQTLGGLDATKKKMNEAVKAKKSRTKLTAVMASLFLLTLVIGLVFGIFGLVPAIPSIIGYLLCGVSAVFLILTIVMALGLRSLDPQKLFHEFRANDLTSALRNIQNALEAERKVKESNRRYQGLQDSINTCVGEKQKLVASAETQLQKWGCHFTEKSSLLTVAATADEAIRQLDAAERNSRDARLLYESAANTLSSFSREHYEAEKARTAYVGEITTDMVKDLQIKLNFWRKKSDALTTQIRTLELEIASRAATTENSDELKETLLELQTTRSEYDDKYKAYLLAHSAIQQAGDRLRAKIAPTLSDMASNLMNSATDGKYQNIGIDNSLSVSFRTDEASPGREVGYLSAGTKALTYISFRLALIRLLFREKTPPTVFDEAFVSLDNTRLAAIMALLADYAKESQVILMTCHDREYQAAADKTQINYIEM